MGFYTQCDGNVEVQSTSAAGCKRVAIYHYASYESLDHSPSPRSCCQGRFLTHLMLQAQPFAGPNADLASGKWVVLISERNWNADS